MKIATYVPKYIYLIPSIRTFSWADFDSGSWRRGPLINGYYFPICFGFTCVSKKDILKLQPLEPQDVILFGGSIVEDVNS